MSLSARILTRQQEKVLVATSAGMASFEVARRLGLTKPEIVREFRLIRQKLGAPTMDAAVAVAYEIRLLPGLAEVLEPLPAPNWTRRNRNITPIDRAKASAAASASQKKYPDRTRARNRVADAIRSGRLKRPMTCEACDSQHHLPIEAAHTDYSKPFLIRWLCRPCHAKFDAWMRLGRPSKGGRRASGPVQSAAWSGIAPNPKTSRLKSGEKPGRGVPATSRTTQP